MRRRSDRRHRWPALLTGVTLAMAMASLLASTHQESDTHTAILDLAIAHQDDGHPERALAVLLPAAEGGDVFAMERLALLHWYGKLLFASHAFNRESGRYWFERAEQQGSALGRYMMRPRLQAAHSK